MSAVVQVRRESAANSDGRFARIGDLFNRRSLEPFFEDRTLVWFEFLQRKLEFFDCGGDFHGRRFLSYELHWDRSVVATHRNALVGEILPVT